MKIAGAASFLFSLMKTEGRCLKCCRNCRYWVTGVLLMSSAFPPFRCTTISLMLGMAAKNWQKRFRKYSDSYPLARLSGDELFVFKNPRLIIFHRKAAFKFAVCQLNEACMFSGRNYIANSRMGFHIITINIPVGRPTVNL